MSTELFQPSRAHAAIAESLRELYLSDARPWLVGFSGGKDSTLLASLVFDAVLEVPAEARQKAIAVVCTKNRTEIPAIVEMIGTSLATCCENTPSPRVSHSCQPDFRR